MFSSNLVTPGKTFASVLSGSPQQLQPENVQWESVSQRTDKHTQQTGQSVQAPTANSTSLDNMFKVATVLQQIMTG
jgi:hypothetical protein